MANIALATTPADVAYVTRPFAACDRLRFGRPTSRDRLIEGPRRDFPHAFGNP